MPGLQAACRCPSALSRAAASLPQQGEGRDGGCKRLWPARPSPAAPQHPALASTQIKAAFARQTRTWRQEAAGERVESGWAACHLNQSPSWLGKLRQSGAPLASKFDPEEAVQTENAARWPLVAWVWWVGPGGATAAGRRRRRHQSNFPSTLLCAAIVHRITRDGMQAGLVHRLLTQVIPGAGNLDHELGGRLLCRHRRLHLFAHVATQRSGRAGKGRQGENDLARHLDAQQ